MSNETKTRQTFRKAGAGHGIALALLLCFIVPERVDAHDPFTLAIMGDPQYQWSCEDETTLGYKTLSPYCSDKANAKKSGHRQAIETNRMAIDRINEMSTVLGTSFRGLVINGDLTSHGTVGGNLTRFRHDYMNQKAFWTWPGLGNHDYEIYVNKCGKYWNGTWNHCCGNMIQFLAGLLKDDKNKRRFLSYDIGLYIQNQNQTGDQRNISGSLAYSWEIDDFHFVQLNDYPNYTVSLVQGYKQGSSSAADSFQLNITSPQQWLQNDLADAQLRKKKIILNWHRYDMYYEMPGDARAHLVEWLTPYASSIKAIFVAHEHYYVGPMYTLDIPIKNPQFYIPVIYSGCPIWTRFIKADFASGKDASGNDTCSITIGQVDTTQKFTGQTTPGTSHVIPCQ